jgi:hypothetical protein
MYVAGIRKKEPTDEALIGRTGVLALYNNMYRKNGMAVLSRIIIKK